MLTDTQSLLLSEAAKRTGGHLYPLPTGTSANAAALARALTTLARRGYIEERETSEAVAVSRTDGDLRFGMFITASGLAAIGVSDSGETNQSAVANAKRTTKIDTVIALLRQPEGVTLTTLVVATGWLPHTTRAALTGLRKKGYAIAKTKHDGVTSYRIEVAA